ncbi:MAG: hypothetical protein ACJ8LN_14105 [Sulfurifustis sp.]
MRRTSCPPAWPPSKHKRGCANETEKNQTIAKVVRGSDHAAHLIDQLLTLARLDRAQLRAMESCGLRCRGGAARGDRAAGV